MIKCLRHVSEDSSRDSGAEKYTVVEARAKISLYLQKVTRGRGTQAGKRGDTQEIQKQSGPEQGVDTDWIDRETRHRWKQWGRGLQSDRSGWGQVTGMNNQGTQEAHRMSSLLGCPSSGEHMMKCLLGCLFVGENMINLACPSGEKETSCKNRCSANKATWY